MEGIILTILILTISNTVFLLGVIYYLVNRFCVDCQGKIEWKRFFKLKDKCEKCYDKKWREL